MVLYMYRYEYMHKDDNKHILCMNTCIKLINKHMPCTGGRTFGYVHNNFFTYCELSDL